MYVLLYSSSQNLLSVVPVNIFLQMIYRSIHARHDAAPRAKSVHLIHALHLHHAALLVRTHGQRGCQDAEREEWEDKSES